MKIFLAAEILADQRRTHNLSVGCKEAAVGLFRKQILANAENQHGIAKAGHKHEDEKQGSAGAEFTKHGSGSHKMADDHINDLDANKGDGHTAEAINQQIASQNNASRGRLIFNAL